ncbi:MAG TPA: multicopper oxidase domain-containing protein [Rhizomicrobium sp.]|nr:multicopper oxidase domain-containing protein [Rhizomicrobium sp.]
MGRIISLMGALLIAALAALVPGQAMAQDTGACPRPAPGSEVLPPPDLFSSNGTLNVALNYTTAVDYRGRTLLCFVTPDGTESPTLHVNPGDTINITLTNILPPVHGGPAEVIPGKVCGDSTMLLTSVNMHFHGTNTSPKCHSDEVIHTLVNPGETFTYTLHIPSNEPPGLYWYHPHVHGIASASVQAGATGAIIVEGIENIQPAVAGLPQRVLVMRDQPLANPQALTSALGLSGPYWDLSVNYVAVPFPQYPPSIIKMQQGSQEFWRVVNAGANTILDLQVMYDGVPQTIQIAALDGVPTGSQDGKRQGTLISENRILIPPAGRAEFIVAAPSAGVHSAQLITNRIDTGPAGDGDPQRTLAQIQTVTGPVSLPHVPKPHAAPNPQRFEGLADAKVTAQRLLYFSEINVADQNDPPGGHAPDNDKHTLFYITVDGQIPEIFDPSNPPAITTTQGAVEEWTIENRTQELHEFHMHQIHFLVEAVNGKNVPREKRQFYDTFQVPYWDGVSSTYPSIKVKMDFRGPTVGDFVYHCHILDHEDGGMMAIIRVLPKN